jgi:hypothetical protein
MTHGMDSGQGAHCPTVSPGTCGQASMCASQLPSTQVCSHPVGTVSVVKKSKSQEPPGNMRSMYESELDRSGFVLGYLLLQCTAQAHLCFVTYCVLHRGYVRT